MWKVEVAAFVPGVLHVEGIEQKFGGAAVTDKHLLPRGPLYKSRPALGINCNHQPETPRCVPRETLLRPEAAAISSDWPASAVKAKASAIRLSNSRCETCLDSSLLLFYLPCHSLPVMVKVHLNSTHLAYGFRHGLSESSPSVYMHRAGTTCIL